MKKPSLIQISWKEKNNNKCSAKGLRNEGKLTILKHPANLSDPLVLKSRYKRNEANNLLNEDIIKSA